jgi:Ca2+-binding EF-hand superfamily protein
MDELDMVMKTFITERSGAVSASYMNSRSDSKKKVVRAELKEADIGFIMANTDFTRDKITKWFDEFIIKSPDGRLYKPEFIDAYKKLIPGESKYEDKYCKYIFYAVDLDNNGYVDFGLLLGFSSHQTLFN